MTIIVTGASRGIGEAVVRSLRVDGVRVVGVARSADALHRLFLEKIGSGPFEYVAGDICDTSVLQRAIALATADGHQLHGVVLNAAVLSPLARIGDLESAAIRRHFEVNVFAQLELLRLALPELRKTRGRIVFVTSGVVGNPMAAWAPYTAAKAAMQEAIKCLAREEPAIVCLCISPGIVDTEMVRRATDEGKEAMDEHNLTWLKSVKKTDDFLEPSVPGNAIAKIVQRASHGLTGQVLSFRDPLLQDTKQ